MRWASRDVLLFFEDFDRDQWVLNDRHVWRFMRRLYTRLHTGSQAVTGFEMWFRLLKRALEQSGKRVYVNARALARKNPSWPVGICGYPWILDEWDLPNPAVIGPGMLDHPSQRTNLMNDSRFRFYVTTCEWHHDLFAPVYGAERCRHWHAGIDLAHWRDLASAPKEVDFLIYDKVRWQRSYYEEVLIEPICAKLRERGYRWSTIRYGRYDHRQFREMLSAARAMLFLCEHETQGMAYQEAMASNVPILAWDPGVWMDPNAASYGAEGVRACSVPFFDAQCGERFRDIGEFDDALARFSRKRGTYTPRAYVRQYLSLGASAATYAALLEEAHDANVFERVACRSVLTADESSARAKVDRMPNPNEAGK